MKKLISVLLVLCMICSFIPVIGASAENVSGEQSGITVVYDWADQIKAKDGNGKTIRDTAYLAEFTFDRSHNLWEYEAFRNLDTYNWHNTYDDKRYIELVRNDALYMAFEIYVPKTGYYTLEQDYGTKEVSDATEIVVHLIKKDGEKAFSTADMTSGKYEELTMNCKAGRTDRISAATPAIKENKYLEQGKYYVVYHKKESGRAYFGNLTLNGGPGKVVTEIASVSAPGEVNVGDTGFVETAVYYSDTTSGTAGAGDVTYTSSNEGVLSVDAETGAYTAKAGGNATITATAGTESKSAEITVEKLEKSGITVVYDWADQIKAKDGNGKTIRDTAYLAEFTFDRSHNLWEYEAFRNLDTYNWHNTYDDKRYIELVRNDALYMAFEIYVPKTGYYTLEQDYGTKEVSDATEIVVHLIKKDGEKAFSTADMNSGEYEELTMNCKAGRTDRISAATPAIKENKYLEQGKYYVVYHKKESGRAYFGNLTLNGGTDEVDKTDDVRYDAPTVDGLDITGTLIEPEYNEETNTFTLTADAEKNGNKFLYWAKGMSENKKIISFSNKLENYKPEEAGRNYLIAVYEGDVPAKAEYYNANGQLIATETEPAKPSMAGYGKAYDWEQYGETGIYVAKYAIEEPQENIKVDVVGGEGSGIYAYGDTVTCTATPSADQTFKCWTKTLDSDKIEIVSVDETYTFKAWEACTVTAVYEYEYKGSAMKIIIDSFKVGNTENGVMAEFIGFGADTVEKGIICNGTKIAMTRPGNQFTVTGDIGDTFKGYAIVKNGADYNLIVDGEVTLTNAE